MRVGGDFTHLDLPSPFTSTSPPEAVTFDSLRTPSFASPLTVNVPTLSLGSVKGPIGVLIVSSF